MSRWGAIRDMGIGWSLLAAVMAAYAYLWRR